MTNGTSFFKHLDIFKLLYYCVTFTVIGFFRIVTSVDRPLCTCGAHVIWSRHRFAMLNDRPRSQAFKQALKQVINISMVNLMS